MKSRIIVAFVMMLTGAVASAYSPVGDRIKTSWAEEVDPKDVWQEYPRPIMERDDWKNLNGLWNYAVTVKNAVEPVRFDGEILVPFAIESSLSGVGRTIGADSMLWYRRTFAVPRDWKGKDVMLNFGAVDWKADVWVNGVNVGTHTGGYTPFSFNITPALNRSGENTLVVRVWDPTDKGCQPRGKQVSRPNFIWYTPVTGIWQTVWLEPVDRVHIVSMRTVPDIDNRKIDIQVTPSVTSPSQMVEVKVLDGAREVASGKASTVYLLKLPCLKASSCGLPTLPLFMT